MNLFISSLKSSDIFIVTMMKTLLYVSTILNFSGPATVGLLSSDGGILSIYSVFVSVSRNLGVGPIVILGVEIWSCWMCVLFLGFCYPLWTLGTYGDCGFPSRECFWVPVGYGHCWSQVEPVRYLLLTQRNGDRLECGQAEGTKGRRKTGSAISFTRAQWSRVREVDKTLKVVCYKGGDETKELELEDRKNKYHLPDSQTGGHEAGSNKRLILL